MAENTIVRWADPKVILVATNLAEDHTFMFQAIRQARLSRAKVLLVHVIPPLYLMTEAVYGTPIAQSNQVALDARAKLDELAAHFQWEGIDCEPIILSGAPEEQIPLLLKSRTVDRIIVAARNASGVERLIGGSVAEALISSLAVPVCTIGHHMGPVLARPTPPERILVAVSLEPESLVLASFASTLAEMHHARLTLLHVLDLTGMSGQDQELARFKARQKLAELIPKSARHRHQPVLLVPHGDPTKVIPEAAGSMSHDLVILGGPVPSLFSSLLGANVVHRVIVEAKCPVITIKSAAEIELETPIHQGALDEDASIVHSVGSTE
jgi:nucleotide-binding universal stress UspA family protein